MSEQKEAVRENLGSRCFTALFWREPEEAVAHWKKDMNTECRMNT